MLNTQTPKIDVSEFETAIDVSSGNDGFLLIRDNGLYFYDRMKEKLFYKKLPVDGKGCKAKDFFLHKNTAEIICENGESESYSLKEFRMCANLVD